MQLVWVVMQTIGFSGRKFGTMVFHPIITDNSFTDELRTR